MGQVPPCVRPFVFEKRTPPRSHDHQQGSKLISKFAAFTLPRLRLLPQQRPATHRRYRPVPTLLTTTSQPGSATNLVDPRSHVTGPIDAPPFIEGCGRPDSPRCPRHNNNNATTSSTSTTIDGPILLAPTTGRMPCQRKGGNEDSRRREWGNTRQPDPYCCPRYAHCPRLTAS